MNRNRYRIFYIGGTPSGQEAVQSALRHAGEKRVIVRSGDLSAFKDALARGTWDAAVIDAQAPDISLPASLSLISRTAKNIPAIVISDKSDVDSTARLLKAGAAYNVPRNNLEQLLAILQTETRRLRSRRDSTEGNQRWLRHAYYDGLTGLPTRALFNEQLLLMIEHAARHKQKFAVFFMDLDKFKSVNDAYGHARGDWLLQSAAKRLSHVISDADILARLGGDEFMLISPIASLAASATIAQRLIQALGSPFIFNNVQAEVSASVGISIYPDHGDDPTVLIQRADQAMYRAKRQGRSCYQFFSTSLDTLARKTEVMESSLLRALKHREFNTHYQPQQRLRDGQMSGVEALIRWQIPGFGFLPPEKFMEAAEETGLIVDIEEFVWRLIFSHIKAWRRKGWPEIPVTLAFSPKHFAQHQAVETLAFYLKEAHLEPSVLTLKIGMNAITQADVPVLPTLRRLKEMGVRLVLNQIGQPYLDFFKLKSVPLHALMIDRALVWDATRDAASAMTVEWLVRLAHQLGLEATAEGVDTPQQLALLKEYGCDQIQGLVYSAPVPPEKLPEHWLTPVAP